jgi:hypothetical protein
VTRERVRATQANETGSGAHMVFRCTITAVNTKTIAFTFPDGSTGVGQRIPGMTYTVNGGATVLIEQPAIGPVIPTA